METISNDNKKNNSKIKPPVEIINAVKLIEEWVTQQTNRDDWAIGNVACRKGFEKLLKNKKKA